MMTTGPGLMRPIATSSTNCCSVSQWWSSTGPWCRKATMARPEPKVSAPALAKKRPMVPSGAPEPVQARPLPDLRPFLPHLPDTYDPSDMRTEAEAVENIFFFNCMGEDEWTGRFELDDDKLRLRWEEDSGDQKVFSDIEGLVRGCRVGPSRDDGVVNDVGQVSDANPDDPAAVHDGLFVVDGSVMPGAIVSHPTMTIVTQALKTMKAAYPAP